MTAKDLKNALLQEAVQGKLVPQIASEGNARDLLNEIRKEKSKLIKEGKLKKEKPLPELTEEEIPFDIPENWCWCRLGEIVPFGTCKNAEPNEIEEEDWILDLEDIEKDSGKILAFKTKKQIDAKSTKHVFIKGNVLYSKLRPYLNKCVIAPKNGFCTSEILPLDFGEHIYNKYAQLYLMSPFFVDYTNSLSFGVKMPRLGTEDGKKALFPLPPFAEQKRIVAAIEKFMPLIEEYGKKETELKSFNEQIGTLTKKAILQEAVQGKLVPQIAAEGNAKDLLEEIKKEKAKVAGKASSTSFASKTRTKEFPSITEDEIPFDIPENWCWCRLGEVTEIARGGSPRPIKDYLTTDEDGYNWIKIGDTDKDGKYINRTAEKIKKEGLNKTRFVHKGDFLLTNSMSFGRPYILNIDGCIHDGWLVISPKDNIFNKDFLYYVLSTTFAYNQFCDSVSGAVVKNLNSDKVRESLFPLPPLAEQKRIVEAIENLLPLCEALKI